MSLTGPVFLDGIMVLTLAAFVAVIIVWPRLTPGSPWHVAGRAGALTLVNLLVLLTAATQLNANYLFFASWGDLRGAVTGHLAQTSLHRGGVERKAPEIPLIGHAAPVTLDPQPLKTPVSSSRLLKYTVHGAISGLTGTVLVHLPDIGRCGTSATPCSRPPMATRVRLAAGSRTSTSSSSPIS